MRFWSPLPILLALACCARGSVVDFHQRSVSASQQFFVYSTDVPLRSRVASFADDIKADVLRLLGLSDRQGKNIVITLDRASASNPSQQPVTFALIEIDGGFKIQIDVHIGENPAQINLQKQIVRAVMLELAYRDHPGAVKGGQGYAEPPWWLVEGAIQIIRKRDNGLDPDLFRRIIDTNKLPSLDNFLAVRHTEQTGDTAFSIDQACAMCLVQSLIDQPSGRENLARYLQHLPDASGEPVAILLRDFPSLAAGQNLQKWWTLSLARFSASDRYQGLSPEETDAQLQALLQFEIPVGKADEKKTFSLSDFEQFIKLPASRAVLEAAQGGLVALSTHANPLYRSVIVEYEQVLALLSHGKIRGIKDRLTRFSQYRESVLRRTTDVTDYINWFEATQMSTRSDAFDGYLKAANELDAPRKRDDPVSKYLDDIAAEF